ncbi:MAG TPA: phage major capsid protein [Blastococcus sp.]|nr:phage major capsid protein [Blastococcus sp.]
MTIQQLLARRAEHEQTVARILAAVGNGSPTAEQATQLRAARDGILTVDDDLDQAQRAQRAATFRRELGVGGARVTGEPTTYGERSGQSFIRDMFASRFLGDGAAAERLNRAQNEARADMQQRAVASSGYAGLVVPQYLVGAVAPVLRAGRPIANSLNRQPLPEQGMILTIPRGTTGAAVGSQATENSALQNTDEVWANLSVPVVTVGGQQDVSRQSIERGTPGLDQIVFRDLAGAYAAELERQIITGSGASNQHLGVLNTAGISTATAFGAAVTATNFTVKVAGAVAAVSSPGTAIAPKIIAMHPRRWAWMLAQVDTTGRPLVSPSGDGPTSIASVSVPGGYSGDGDDLTTVVAVGKLHGLPVITSSQIPTNLGTTGTEDVVLVLDADELLLFEDDPLPRFLRFDEPLGGNLTIKLVSYAYSAFTAGRYPQASARVGAADTVASNGLQAPAF